ncbi:MAG: T9SS type A sorting domain-containing protein [Bacteroidales bacterium]|nr:T9SS type A sorting domain-containing protein [Bacteroidales bacterium]
MKKLVYNLILLLTALCFPAIAHSQEIVEIGNESLGGYRLPLDMEYNYSISQQIYTADEIEVAGTISSVSFYFLRNDLSLYMSDIQLYMMHTTKTSFGSNTDIVALDSATLVYDGDLSATGAGWVTLALNTAFEYNGTDNLLICMCDTTIENLGSAYMFSYSNTSGRSSSLCYYSNSYIPDVNDLSAFSGGRNKYSYRSNIRIGITPLAGQCFKPTSLAASNVSAYGALVSWTAREGETSWQICLNDNEDSLINVDASPYELIGLTPETAYNVKMRTICCENAYSDWTNNVSFTTIPVCPFPTNLVVAERGTTTATIRWDAGGEETSWQICINNDRDNLINVSDNEYTITGLIPNTYNYVKVRANCNEDGYSNWTDNSIFRTLVACETPTGLTCTSTANSATISWTAGGDETLWNLEYKSSSDNNWTIISGLTTPTYTITEPTPSAIYKVNVIANCESDGTSAWLSGSFSTYFPPFSEDFWTTDLPANWSRYKGLLSSVMEGSTLSPTSSEYCWYFGQNNAVLNYNHAWVNLWGTSRKEWLVTPSIVMDVDAKAQLKFDLALNKCSGSIEPVDATQQMDDKFVVLISTDDGSTWTILRQYDNEGSVYVYNNIATTGEEVVIEYTNYIDSNVKIAFYGESTEVGGDVIIHVDNVIIDYIRPNVTNITATSANVSWLGGENNWIIKYGNHGFDVETEGLTVENISQTSYSLTRLSPNTSYDVYVKAVGSVKWLMTSFRTDCGVQDIPYSETFEEISNRVIPPCWKSFGNGASQVSYSGTNYLYMRTDGITPQITTLPIMDDINALRLSFWAKCPNILPEVFQIGYIAEGVFFPIESLTLTPTYQHFNVPFNNAPENAEKIAIYLFNPTISTCVNIDDIEVDYIQSCSQPISLNVSNTTATISWIPLGIENAWQYTLDDGITWNDFANAPTGTTKKEATIVGLASNTNYTVKVRAYCSDNEQSEASNEVTFYTEACEADDMCEISYCFYDRLGDGWEGSAINVVDVETNRVLATWTIAYGRSATGTLRVCNEMDIRFEWIQGSSTNECSYAVYDARGDVIFTGEGSMSSNINYRVNCSVCRKPTELVISDIGFTDATLTWGAENETAWQICFNDDESNLIDVTGSPLYSFTGLDTATNYSLKVRTVCGDDNDISHWSPKISFTTDTYLCEVADQCEINFVLTDSRGDGWEGNAIKVTDVATGYVLGTFANEDLNLSGYASVENEVNTHTLMVCNGREIQFSWVSGSFSAECSYMVTDVNGAEILSGSDAMSEPVNYIVNCDGCRIPTALDVSNIGITSATLTWTAGADETAWQICLNDDEENIINATSNSHTFTDLASETSYMVKVRAECGENGYSLWSANIPFTTLISCHVPTSLTSIDSTTTAVLTWVPGESEENWLLQYGTDYTFAEGTYTEISVSNNPTYEILGLTPEVVYYARVKAICGDDDESAWSTICDVNPTLKRIIGQGNATHCYLPTDCVYKYSMTQQIYTAEELGNEAYTIQSIDFYAMENCTRYLKIYLVATDKESFDGRTDWIAVSDADRVFSGSVTFTSNAWKTITLTNPFGYNGISNVAIIVDDNTVSIVQNEKFRTFPATSQAICIQSDVTNFNPLNPTVYYGTIISTKNQIRLSTTEPPSCINPWSLTASNIGVNEATITWSAVPDQTAWQICINGDEDNLIDVDAPTYTLTDLTEETTYTVKVRANCGTETSGWVTISFTTLAPSYTIIATAGENGAITPSGAITVTEGDDQTFRFMPDEGYRLENVLVDGTSVMSNLENNTYTFINVTEDHTIHATFEMLVSVDMANEQSVSIYPNPNNGTFSIKFGNMDGSAIYQLFDVSGAMLETRNINVTNNETVVFSHRLIVGTYFVRIIADDKVFVEKLVVE